jgi:ribonucleoside-triphosphate reductase (thioredoxin)
MKIQPLKVLDGKIEKVRKRDGRVVNFDQTKITSAIYKAMKATQEGDLSRHPQRVSERVVKTLAKRLDKDQIPDIEKIQDIVEESLILMDFPKTAKSYIIYRHERANIRERSKEVPQDIKELVRKSSKYFQNPFSEFIYYRTYSRWIENEGRRETWIETVDRYVNFMKKRIKGKLEEEEYEKIRQAILNQEAMPSMRLVWSAGKAVEASNVCAYNCSYIAPTKLRDFSEIMYILMCGAGLGFSVESRFVQQLPLIKPQTGKKLPVYIIKDSKEGWGDALTTGLETWYTGKDIEFDYSQLRPAGSRLHTMGGRSSGPEPLRSLLNFSRSRILERQGKRLRNIDVHDIICKIGELVVMGGVRRSALISLSDLDDERMLNAKMGEFYVKNPQRTMANNSAVYTEKPSSSQFLEEWLGLMKGGSGERGIFNRGGLEKQTSPRRWKTFQKYVNSAGTNPCGEIILRSKGFCNLTEVVARPEDTEESLLRKVTIATILGTFQATLTDFHYISREWRKNCDEERLLGVSITGQWDCPVVRQTKTLRNLKQKAIEVNKEYAKRFGINVSNAVTSVKPSGTVSQLVNSSSGMHPRYAPYYIRRVRIAASDPLFQMLKDQKFPYHPEVGQSETTASTYVLEFPVKSPDNAVFRNDLKSIEQLEYWKTVKTEYTEHNPSQTILIGEDEWIGAAHWIYKNWDIVGGLSFLPRNNHVYKLSPYEEITKEEYENLSSKMPEIDFSQIIVYEKDDQTTGAKAPACESAVCELNPDLNNPEKKQ